MLWLIYFPLGPVDTFLFLMPIGLKVKKKKKILDYWWVSMDQGQMYYSLMSHHY